MTVFDPKTGKFVRQNEVFVETTNIGQGPSNHENDGIVIKIEDVGQARWEYPRANANHCMAIDNLDPLINGGSTVNYINCRFCDRRIKRSADRS